MYSSPGVASVSSRIREHDAEYRPDNRPFNPRHLGHPQGNIPKKSPTNLKVDKFAENTPLKNMLGN